MKITRDLETVAQSVKEIIDKEYSSHCAVVITADSVKVISVEFSAPLS